MYYCIIIIIVLVCIIMKPVNNIYQIFMINNLFY